MKISAAYLEDRIKLGRQAKIVEAGLPPASTLKEFFVNYVWPILEPGRDFDDNWHVDLLCEELERLYYTRKTGDDLQINIAPRHLKSRICSIGFPCWVWTKEANIRFLCISYTSVLSTDHNLDRKKVVESLAYQALTEGRCALTHGISRSTEFENISGGYMLSRGLDGSVMGGGGDFLIFDDPNSPEKLESIDQLEKVRKKFNDYFSTRKNHPRETRTLLVMQRMHELDCGGRAEELGFRTISLPTVAMANQIVAFPSGRTVERKKGDLLHPARIDEVDAAELKLSLGRYMWEARHQQNPIPIGGGLFREIDVRFWHPAGRKLPPVEVQDSDGKTHYIKSIQVPTAFAIQLQSWDCSFKNLKDNDYVAGGVLGKLNKNIFVLDIFRKQVDVVRTCQAVLDMTKRHPMATRKLIEDKANGPAAIQLLASRVPGLTPVTPLGGKEARAIATQPVVDSHSLYLPHPLINEHTETLLGEMTKFPKAKHDDLLDMLTQGCCYLIQKDPVGSAAPLIKETKLPFSPASRDDLASIFA